MLGDNERMQNVHGRRYCLLATNATFTAVITASAPLTTGDTLKGLQRQCNRYFHTCDEIKHQVQKIEKNQDLQAFSFCTHFSHFVDVSYFCPHLLQ